MNNLIFYDFTFDQYRDSIYRAMLHTCRFALIACDDFNTFIVDEINENDKHKHNIECRIRDFYHLYANDDYDRINDFDQCMIDIENYVFDEM